MKLILLTLFYCAILKSSLSVPVKDVSQVNVKRKVLKTNLEKSASIQHALTVDKSLENAFTANNPYDRKNGDLNERFFPKTNSLSTIEKRSAVSYIRMQPSYGKKKENRTSLTSEMKEYFFLNDWYGNVTIIDQEYNIITSYKLPEIADGIAVVVDNKFYNIDTLRGQIMRTDIKNLMTTGKDIEWDIIGVFPKDIHFIRNQVAVNDSSTIYFVTFSGILYAYNINLKSTMRIGNIVLYNDYASLLIVDKILYIHMSTHFYSFDGKTLKEIETPIERKYCGLFQMGSQVCRLGGNIGDTFPDPVSCYDPKSGQWSINGILNELMWYPAIATNQFGIHVFGGFYTFGNNNGFWRDTCLILDPDNLFLGYIQCPFTEAPEYPQAFSFFH